MVPLDAKGLVGINYAGPQNPDALIIWSKDANAAAASVIVTSPLEPVGTVVTLQLYHSKEPTVPYQFVYTLKSGDTPQSVAEMFAALIEANATLAAAGVGGQYIGGTQQFGVSHRFDDQLSLTACAYYADGTQVMKDAGGTFFFQSMGGTRLDAGPQMVLIRDPDGWTPEAGSSIGQWVAEARLLNGALTQYVMDDSYIIDPDPAHPRGEKTFNTIGLVDGQPAPVKRFGIGHGFYSAGCSDMGDDTINVKAVYLNGVKVLG
jgi:hypothetical protein